VSTRVNAAFERGSQPGKRKALQGADLFLRIPGSQLKELEGGGGDLEAARRGGGDLEAAAHNGVEVVAGVADHAGVVTHRSFPPVPHLPQGLAAGLPHPPSLPAYAKTPRPPSKLIDEIGVPGVSGVARFMSHTRECSSGRLNLM